jgi:hypothetical protein
MSVKRIFECVDCGGEKEPCLFIEINTTGEDSPPEYCPNVFERCNWKELKKEN